jgi:RimJ/RimL family protein N-acetyltransferase
MRNSGMYCMSLCMCADAGQDNAAFRRLFFTLSDTTRYLYFSCRVPSNGTWAERFAALGHANDRDSYVLVAEVADGLVGFTRFSRSPQADPETVDIGILLTDAWQSRGLGAQMLRLAHHLFPDMSVNCGFGTCELSMDL